MIIYHMPRQMEAALIISAATTQAVCLSPLEMVLRAISKKEPKESDLYAYMQRSRVVDTNDCVTVCSGHNLYWNAHDCCGMKTSFGRLVTSDRLNLILGVYTDHENQENLPIYTIADKDGDIGIDVLYHFSFDPARATADTPDDVKKIFGHVLVLQMRHGNIIDIRHEGQDGVPSERISIFQNAEFYYRAFQSAVDYPIIYDNDIVPYNGPLPWVLQSCIDWDHFGKIEEYIARKNEMPVKFPEKNMLQDRVAESLISMIDAVCDVRIK